MVTERKITELIPYTKLNLKLVNKNVISSPFIKIIKYIINNLFNTHFEKETL